MEVKDENLRADSCDSPETRIASVSTRDVHKLRLTATGRCCPGPAADTRPKSILGARSLAAKRPLRCCGQWADAPRISQAAQSVVANDLFGAGPPARLGGIRFKGVRNEQRAHPFSPTSLAMPSGLRLGGYGPSACCGSSVAFPCCRFLRPAERGPDPTWGWLVARRRQVRAGRVRDRRAGRLGMS